MEHVHHPKHYADCSISVEPMELTGRVNSALGQALQYIMRRTLKENEYQDISKAIFWLDWFQKELPTKSLEETVYIGTFTQDAQLIAWLIELFRDKTQDPLTRAVLLDLFPEGTPFTSSENLINTVNRLVDQLHRIDLAYEQSMSDPL